MIGKKFLKVGLFLTSSLFSFLSVFGDEHDTSLFSSEFFNQTESILTSIGDGIRNNHVLVDSIGIIIFVFCLGVVYHYLLRFLFKEKGSAPARKATSLILALLTSVGLLQVLETGENFLSYFGKIIVFAAILILIIVGFCLFCKFLYDRLWEGDSYTKKCLLVILSSLGLIFIDITLGRFIQRLYCGVNPECDVPVLFGSILKWIGGIGWVAQLILIGSIVALIFCMFKDHSMKKSSSNSSSDEDDEKRQEEISKLKANLKDAALGCKNLKTNFSAIKFPDPVVGPSGFNFNLSKKELEKYKIGKSNLITNLRGLEGQIKSIEELIDNNSFQYGNIPDSFIMSHTNSEASNMYKLIHSATKGSIYSGRVGKLIKSIESEIQLIDGVLNTSVLDEVGYGQELQKMKKEHNNQINFYGQIVNLIK